jgi:hypothetical protein
MWRYGQPRLFYCPFGDKLSFTVPKVAVRFVWKFVSLFSACTTEKGRPRWFPSLPWKICCVLVSNSDDLVIGVHPNAAIFLTLPIPTKTTRKLPGYSKIKVMEWSRDGSVVIAKGYRMGGRCSIPGRGKRLFSIPFRLDRLWSPASLLNNGYRGLFPRDKGGEALSWSLTSI